MTLESPWYNPQSIIASVFLRDLSVSVVTLHLMRQPPPNITIVIFHSAATAAALAGGDDD